MRKSLRNTPPLRLDANRYRELHREVLERDGWRCQICGSLQRLQVHHLELRSRSGSDLEQNLITLCTDCHARAHQTPALAELSCRNPCLSSLPRAHARRPHACACGGQHFIPNRLC